MCSSVRYNNGRAERRIIVDGKLNFNFSTEFLTTTIWPRNRVFTFGGREFEYAGNAFLKGSISDVQIFSRYLSDSEMQGYTLCVQVKTSLHPSVLIKLAHKTIVFKELEGDLASWNDQSIWRGSSNEVRKVTISKEEICGTGGSSKDILMLMPSQVNWHEAKEACRRFGGRLHIDRSEESVKERSFSLIAKGETESPERCIRVWLGASDIKEEGVWRDSETDEVLDISEFWVDGQPNGVRVQNCAGIWELVWTVYKNIFLESMNLMAGWVRE